MKKGLFNYTTNLISYMVSSIIVEKAQTIKGNHRPPCDRLFFLIKRLCALSPHAMVFDTQVVEHWLEWKITQLAMQNKEYIPTHTQVLFLKYGSTPMALLGICASFY